MCAHDLIQKEVWSVQQAWREVFARRLHRLTGRWTMGIDRDVFRRNAMLKYLSGPAAEAEYASAQAHMVYVIDDRGNGERRACPDGEKPALTEFIEKRGVLIFPEDLAWSVAVGADYWEQVSFTYRGWVDDDDPGSSQEEPNP
jgi:hypothetical protein